MRILGTNLKSMESCLRKRLPALRPAAITPVTPSTRRPMSWPTQWADSGSIHRSTGVPFWLVTRSGYMRCSVRLRRSIVPDWNRVTSPEWCTRRMTEGCAAARSGSALRICFAMMIEHVVQRAMEFDIDNLCNAGYDERSAERAKCRNGYRERLWETRAGSIPVKMPTLREGSHFPPFLETPHGRESPGRRDPGGLCLGRLDAFLGQTRQSYGHERNLQEPLQPAVRRHRRARERVPRSAARGRLAVRVDRCDLREATCCAR